MPSFRAVIGLEVHAQLQTRSKMFCSCPAGYGGGPNERVCPVCLGFPGALPFPNREAVRLAVRFARAIDAEVHELSTWARKNYFYPDLPKGYQISQFDRPLATAGRIRIEPEGTPPRWIGVRRVHLEEDAGKSVHEGFGDAVSGIDLNRCGLPLIEIVGEPALTSPDEALLYLERLRSILRATSVSNADMEKGELRCDANVSLHRDGEPIGTRVEIKNLNSFRNVRRALRHEIERQGERLRAGRPVEPETRLWDEADGVTRPMRTKEEAHDYRYFQEPDLPPLRLDEELTATAISALPELPHARRDRYISEMGLSAGDAHRLTIDPAVADFFERVVAAVANPRAAASWVLNSWLGLLHERGLSPPESPVAPDALAEIIRLVDSGAVSGRAAREVFAEVAAGGRPPREIVDARGLSQLSDEDALKAICGAVLGEHPDEVATYRAGKRGLLGFFVGRVIERTGGRANPLLVSDALRRLLE